MNNNVHYQFIYNENSGDSCSGMFPVAKTVSSTVVFDDSQTWDAILDEFIKFLSSIYGYDISKSVEFRSVHDKLRDLAEDGSIDLDNDEDLWGSNGKEFA